MKKFFIIVLLTVYMLLALSCSKTERFEELIEMNILASNYYQKKLSLIKLNKNIIEEKSILDLTELQGKRIIRSGFLSPNIIYVAFEGTQSKPGEKTVHVRMYDTVNFNWRDVFTYKSTNDNIKKIDIENDKGYSTGYVHKNILKYLDFQNQTNSTIIEFDNDVEIISIDCRYSDHYVIINTYNEVKNLFHYYFVDKSSNEIINEDVGQIYVSKYSDFVVYENNSKVYLLDELVNPTIKIEIPVENNKVFSKAIAVDKNSFIICFYWTSLSYIGTFLFGGKQVIEHYDYWFIRILDNDEIEYKKIYNNRNYFDGMTLCDVTLSN